jgi:hypothetical protein
LAAAGSLVSAVALSITSRHRHALVRATALGRHLPDLVDHVYALDDLAEDDSRSPGQIGDVLGRHVAAGPGRTGATAASMMETPSPRQARMLASAWPRGVLEVHGDPPDRDPVSGRPRGRRERRPCLDGVAERDLLAAQLVQSSGERGHPFGGDRPFVRRAEHTGKIGPHLQAGGPPAADERLQALEAITRPAVRCYRPARRRGRGFGMTAAPFWGDK